MQYQEQLAAATINQTLYEKLQHAWPGISLQEPEVTMTGNVVTTTDHSEAQPARQILEFVGAAFVALIVLGWIRRKWRRRGK